MPMSTRITAEGSLFTPSLKPGGPRLKMLLSPQDARKIQRGRGWSAVVTDLLTGCKWRAKAAPCGIPTCFCAATVELVAGFDAE